MVGHLVVPVAFLPYTRTVVAVSIAVVLPLALLLALLLVPANNKTKKKIRKSARLRCVHEHVCDITKIIKIESYNHIIPHHTLAVGMVVGVGVGEGVGVGVGVGEGVGSKSI